MISINSIMESEENNDLMGLLLLCQHILYTFTFHCKFYVFQSRICDYYTKTRQ